MVHALHTHLDSSSREGSDFLVAVLYANRDPTNPAVSNTEELQARSWCRQVCVLFSDYGQVGSSSLPACHKLEHALSACHGTSPEVPIPRLHLILSIRLRLIQTSLFREKCFWIFERLICVCRWTDSIRLNRCTLFAIACGDERQKWSSRLAYLVASSRYYFRLRTIQYRSRDQPLQKA